MFGTVGIQKYWRISGNWAKRLVAKYEHSVTEPVYIICFSNCTKLYILNVIIQTTFPCSFSLLVILFNVPMRACAHKHTHTHTHTHKRVCTYTSMCTLIHTHTYTQACTHTHIHTHTHKAHAHTHTHKHVHTHTYTCPPTYAHTHACMHTHTESKELVY